MFRHQRVAFCLATTVVVLLASCAQADPEGPHGQIIKRGLIDCFPAGLMADEKPVFAETSAVAFDGSRLYIASDKPIPGEGRSAAFFITQNEPFEKIQTRPLNYMTSAAFVTARKFEDFTLTPCGEYVIGTTGFDRLKADAADWNAYNTLLYWPVGKPDQVRVVSPSEDGGIISSVGLRAKLSAAMSSDDFPEGVPYFKVEGLAAMPGNRLLFGIREFGRRFDDFEYAIRIVAVNYEMGESGMTLGDEFQVIYDFDASGLTELNLPIGISSIEYDRHHDRLYLLTSFEREEEGDEGLGAYLWTLSMAALEDGAAPQLIRKADGKPLLLAHKGEGVAVLNEKSVFVIHDDDRELGRPEITNPETQFSREKHQAAFTVIGLP